MITITMITITVAITFNDEWESEIYDILKKNTCLELILAPGGAVPILASRLGLK